MRTRRILITLAALLLVAAGCGDDDTDVSSGELPGDTATDEPTDDTGDDTVSSPAGGTCPAGTPDCNDTPGDLGPPDGFDIDVEAERAEAEALLGTPEAELADDVRIARRGAESFPLTEDYMLGRDTVELDDDGSGTFVVTSVTVELPDGPETFDA